MYPSKLSDIGKTYNDFAEISQAEHRLAARSEACTSSPRNYTRHVTKLCKNTTSKTLNNNIQYLVEEAYFSESKQHRFAFLDQTGCFQKYINDIKKRYISPKYKMSYFTISIFVAQAICLSFQIGSFQSRSKNSTRMAGTSLRCFFIQFDFNIPLGM